MMLFFRIFKHLLPTGRAWRITTEKRLREFFEGLSGLGADVKTFLDLIWLDLFPASTRELDAWDKQFGLPNTGLTDQQRRDRLDATWKALGGQDPQYIQDTLQANGFTVFVHEWWVPGSEAAVNVKACATPRDPTAVLPGQPLGYPLVNKIVITKPNILPLCGEPLAQCGEPSALCGNYTEFTDTLKEYTVPIDPEKWPYFLYIGAQVFPGLANVDLERKDEFEALCLKICPTQQWLGILVTYI